MPPQIKQAKLETLEAIIKEVEGMIFGISGYTTVKEAIEWARFQVTHDTSHSTEGAEVSALYRLLTKLETQKELIENEG